MSRGVRWKIGGSAVDSEETFPRSGVSMLNKANDWDSKLSRNETEKAQKEQCKVGVLN